MLDAPWGAGKGPRSYTTKLLLSASPSVHVAKTKCLHACSAAFRSRRSPITAVRLVNVFLLMLVSEEKVTRNSCDGRRIRHEPPCVTQGAGNCPGGISPPKNPLAKFAQQAAVPSGALARGVGRYFVSTGWLALAESRPPSPPTLS